MEDLKSDYSRRSDGQVRLVWEYSPDSPEIKIDSPKVKQIVQNLIDNGLKFTMQGSVTVTARSFSDVRKVEFQVKDTGIGIGAQDQKIIFDMFHQVDSSDTRTYGGAGVGLFVAKKFVELLGGDIHVESELGRGSTFTVTLPYSPA
jgi:signal transduction histidine kinase